MHRPGRAKGWPCCEDAAAALEAVGTRQYLPEVYQDLCYGALQEGRFEDARVLGEKALTVAREYAHESVERNTLMLLADAAMDAGRRSRLPTATSSASPPTTRTSAA